MLKERERENCKAQQKMGTTSSSHNESKKRVGICKLRKKFPFNLFSLQTVLHVSLSFPLPPHSLSAEHVACFFLWSTLCAYIFTFCSQSSRELFKLLLWCRWFLAFHECKKVQKDAELLIDFYFNVSFSIVFQIKCLTSISYSIFFHYYGSKVHILHMS